VQPAEPGELEKAQHLVTPFYQKPPPPPRALALTASGAA